MKRNFVVQLLESINVSAKVVIDFHIVNFLNVARSTVKNSYSKCLGLVLLVDRKRWLNEGMVKTNMIYTFLEHLILT
jgi:hypothetical protein